MASALVNSGGSRIRKLICSLGNENNNLEQTLLEIAREIYAECLEAVFKLDYTDKDSKENTGCKDPFAKILEHLKSLGLGGKEDNYCLHNLARPAFWFASKKMWRTQPYQGADGVLGPFHLWNLKESLDKEHKLRRGYMGEFDRYKDYLIYNIKTATGYADTET